MQVCNRILGLVMVLLISSLLTNCKDDDVITTNYPRLRTLEVGNISVAGATFNAEIMQEGNKPIHEYGFVWGERENPVIELAEKMVLTEKISGGRYSSQISTTLKEDQIYYVRAFAKSGQYLVYGKNVSFMSAGSKSPIIEKLVPSLGFWGDTILIEGKNFSYVKNTVHFGSIESPVISSTDTSILTTVPFCLDEAMLEISVSILEHTAKINGEYGARKVKISSFYPTSGLENDIVEIVGDGFNPDNTSVILGKNIAPTIQEITTTYLKVKLPPEMKETGNTKFIISTGCSTTTSDNEFTLTGVLLEGISQETGIIGRDIITLTGEGFSTIPGATIITIDNQPYEVDFEQLTGSQISFYIPGDAPIGTHKLGINVNGKEYTNPFDFNFITPWTRKTDLPGTPFGSYGSTFVLNGKIYFANGTPEDDRDFWEFNPEMDSWTRKKDIPGYPYSYRSYFVLNEKGYLGTHLSYDPNTDSWTDLASLRPPGAFNGGLQHGIAFSNGKNGYFFGGRAGNYNENYKRSSYWEYDESLNRWRIIGDFEDFRSFASFSHPAGFSIDGKFYMGLGATNINQFNSLFWEFDPEVNQWKKIKEFPGTPRSGAIGFSLNGKGYVGLGYNSDTGKLKDFWTYDPETDEWKRIADLPAAPREGAVAAAVAGKAYVGFGNDENDLWEFE